MPMHNILRRTETTCEQCMQKLLAIGGDKCNGPSSLQQKKFLAIAIMHDKTAADEELAEHR